MNWKRKLRTSILLLTGVMTGIMCYAQNDFISKYAYPEFDEGHEYRVSGVKSFVEGGEITGYVFTGHRIRDEDRELFIFKTDLKGTPQWVQRVPVETVSTIAFQHIDGSTYIAHRISQDGNVHVFSIDQSGAKQWDFYIEETYMYNPIKMKEIKHDNEVVLGLTSGHFEENIINFTAFEPSGNLIGSNHIENFTSLSNNKLVGFSQLPNENIIMSGSPFLNRLNLLEFEIGNNTPVQDVQRRVNYVDEMVVNDIIEIENPNNYMNSPYYLIGGEINGSIMVAMLDDNMNLVWVNHISGRSSVAFELQKETAGYRALLKVRDNLKNYHTIGTVYFEVDAGGITTTGDIIDANNPIGTTSSFVFNTIPTFDIGVDGLSVLATSDYHENDPFLVFLNDMGGTDIGYPPCRLDNIETNYGSYTLGDVYELNLDIYEVGVYPAEIELNTSGFQYQYSCNTPCDVDLEVTGRVCESGNGDQATLTVTSGHSSFSWNTGQSSNSINVDEPGIYTVTVSGYGGCNVAKTFYLEGDPDISSGFQIVPEDQTDLCVFDEPEVEIRLDPIPLDPTGNSTYDWTIDQLGGFDDEVVNGVFLTPGQVSIALDHNNGCGTNLFNSTINIHGVELDPEVINPICHDDAGTGEINLNPTNEYVNGSVNYYWDEPTGQLPIPNGETNPQNLHNGTYTVTVEASSYPGSTCEKILNIEIDSPDPIINDYVMNRESCPGDADGAAYSDVSGGTPPYSYEWWELDGNGNKITPSLTNTSPDITNTSPGSYIVRVTDDNGCFEEFEIDITSSTYGASIVENTSSITGLSCFGSCDAEIDFNFSINACPTIDGNPANCELKYIFKDPDGNLITDDAPPYKNLCDTGFYSLEVYLEINNEPTACTLTYNPEITTGNSDWHIRTQNSEEVNIAAIADDDEYIYVLGDFEDQADLHGGTYPDITLNSGNQDKAFFVAQYDLCANLQWVTHSHSSDPVNIEAVDMKLRDGYLRILFNSDNSASVLIYNCDDGSSNWDCNLEATFNSQDGYGTVRVNAGDGTAQQGFNIVSTSPTINELTSVEYINGNYFIAGNADNHPFIAELQNGATLTFSAQTDTSQANADAMVNAIQHVEINNTDYIFATGTADYNLLGGVVNSTQDLSPFVARLEANDLSQVVIDNAIVNSLEVAEGIDLAIYPNASGTAADIAVIGNFTSAMTGTGWNTTGMSDDAFIVYYENGGLMSGPTWVSSFGGGTATSVSGKAVSFDPVDGSLFAAGIFEGGDLNGTNGVSFSSSAPDMDNYNIWNAKISGSGTPSGDWIISAGASSPVDVKGVTVMERNGFTAGNYEAELVFSAIHPQQGIPPSIDYNTSGTGTKEGFVARYGDFAGTMGAMFYKKDPNQNSDEETNVFGDDLDKAKDVQPQLKVYPNPNRGRFEILLETGNNEQMKVELYDATGKMIMSRDYGAHRVSPDLTLAPGLYILRVTNANETFTEQLIVQ